MFKQGDSIEVVVERNPAYHEKGDVLEVWHVDEAAQTLVCPDASGGAVTYQWSDVKLSRSCVIAPEGRQTMNTNESPVALYSPELRPLEELEAEVWGGARASIAHPSVVMGHQEVSAKCQAFDQTPSMLVYILSTNRQTFRLEWVALQWGSLGPDEKYCLVKNKSYFLTEAAAIAAKDRALAQ